MLDLFCRLRNGELLALLVLGWRITVWSPRFLFSAFCPQAMFWGLGMVVLIRWLLLQHYLSHLKGKCVSLGKIDLIFFFFFFLQGVTIKTRGGRANLSHARDLIFSDTVISGILAPTGFVDFLRLDIHRTGYFALLRALAERWWDTTNTFHFPCGELTVTPAELTVLTGVRFGSRQLEFYDDWRSLSDERLEELLGIIPSRESCYVTRKWVRDSLSAHYAMSSGLYTPTQAARLCVLLIVGCSFWHTRRDTVDLGILRSLEDMAVVDEYNWGGAMLCMMYREMSDLSRGVVTSFGGTYVIWEVLLLPHFFFF